MAQRYRKRGYGLPKGGNGSNDLIDTLRLDSETGYLADVSKEPSAKGFMIRATLPHKASHTDIEITVEGRNLHITGTRPGNDLPSESVIEVPAGYEMEGARAVYMAGSLRIFVPRE